MLTENLTDLALDGILAQARAGHPVHLAAIALVQEVRKLRKEKADLKKTCLTAVVEVLEITDYQYEDGIAILASVMFAGEDEEA